MLESSEVESELAVRGLVLSAFFFRRFCLAVADLGDRGNALPRLPFAFSKCCLIEGSSSWGTEGAER